MPTCVFYGTVKEAWFVTSFKKRHICLKCLLEFYHKTALDTGHLERCAEA